MSIGGEVGGGQSLEKVLPHLIALPGTSPREERGEVTLSIMIPPIANSAGKAMAFAAGRFLPALHLSRSHIWFAVIQAQPLLHRIYGFESEAWIPDTLRSLRSLTRPGIHASALRKPETADGMENSFVCRRCVEMCESDSSVHGKRCPAGR